MVVLNIVQPLKLPHNANIAEKCVNQKVENYVDGKTLELTSAVNKKTASQMLIWT